LSAVLLPLLLATAAAAADIEGSADHALVGRYEGSTITFYETRDYDEIRLPVRPGDGPEDLWTDEFAGRITSIGYDGPEGHSALQIVRNIQTALEQSGFESVFYCRGADDCEPGFSVGVFSAFASSKVPISGSLGSIVYLLAKRSDADGLVNVALVARERTSQPLQTQLALTVVESAPLETGRVAVVAAPEPTQASEMEASIDATGKVAIYGLYFDFDSDRLQPDSGPQLTELAALMAARPALQAIVVGHTDGQGAFDYNLALSQRRAQSVVNALVAGGVDPARLTPAGAGMVSPVARNNTEEGRALNRRVEIVELWRE
jgi:outer membrane protein OmpA-like peptidoglycan-associated protein